MFLLTKVFLMRALPNIRPDGRVIKKSLSVTLIQCLSELESVIVLILFVTMC